MSPFNAIFTGLINALLLAIVFLFISAAYKHVKNTAEHEYSIRQAWHESLVKVIKILGIYAVITGFIISLQPETIKCKDMIPFSYCNAWENSEFTPSQQERLTRNTFIVALVIFPALLGAWEGRRLGLQKREKELENNLIQRYKQQAHVAFTE